MTRRSGGRCCSSAWGGSALATWLYTKAFTLDFSHALTVVLLQKTQPLVAIVLAGWLLGERRTPLFWVWGAAAMAGAYLLIGFQKPPSLTDIHTEQALLALGAAALWGAATVAGRSLTSALSPRLLAGARFALAVPALALLTLVPMGHAATPTHSAHYAGLFLLLIVLLPDLAGMGLYYLGPARDDGVRGDAGRTVLSADLAAHRPVCPAHARPDRAVGRAGPAAAGRAGPGPRAGRRRAARMHSEFSGRSLPGGWKSLRGRVS